MRWSTPGIRTVSKLNLGYKLKNNPKPKSVALRRAILSAEGGFFPIANAIEMPTMNKKKGKTRSVGVQPFQCAWSNGA